MLTLIDITSEAELSSHLAVLSDSTLIILHFYTPWTAFCTNTKAALSDIASQYPITIPPTLIVSINAKELLDVAWKYDVSTAPRIVFVRGGRQLESIKGFDITGLHNALIVTPVQELPLFPRTQAFLPYNWTRISLRVLRS
jgi:thioredoxin-like negative regulator of GroEL